MYLFLKGLGTVGEPARVGIDSTYTMVIELVDSGGGDGMEGGWNGSSERLDGVQTILPCVIFRGTPKPFNEVQLTVKLRVKNYRVTGRLYLLLKLPFLGLKIRL